MVGEIGSGPSIFGADTLQGAPNNNTPFVARWENCCGKIGIIGSNSICPGFSTSLSASGGFGTYAWSNGDSTSTIKVSPSQSQRYSLTVNEGICVSSDSILVTVKPLPTITFSGDSAVCKGDSGVIIASGGDSYVWNTGATSNSISVVQFVATTYSVQVTKAGCVKDTTIKVPVTPLPVGAIISKSTVCPDSAIVLTAMGGSSYLWSTNSTNSSITVFPSSTSTYWVAVTLHGCTDTVSKLILTRPLPSITACCNTVINEGQSVSLSSSGNGSYSWSPSTGLSCDTCPDPVATPAQTTTYTLTVISDSGCVVRDFITIDISCGEVFIPDAFAPSDPMMHNNILYVRGACIASMDFLVFDRWGNKIFESENQDKGWDGNYNGQAMNTGTYIWYLKATLRDGTSIERKGNVTLVR